MRTLEEVLQLTGTEVFDYLARDAEVPVVTTAACQGDVSILKVTTKKATTPIPDTGVAVVKSEVGGNTHSLYGAGFFDYAAGGRVDDLAIGTLTVPADGETFLLHPEHGGMQIAPGTYKVGRQREYAGEWRAVAD